MTENLIYGTRALMEAINNGREFDRIYIQKGINNPLVNELRALLKDRGLLYQQVPVEKLNRIGERNHQGVVAYLSTIEYHSIEQLLPEVFATGAIPLLLMLDRITDVRNFGAIARTAACTGVHGLIIPSRGSALINPDAIKTSAGALHSLPVCREGNLKSTLDYLSGSGLQIIACTEKANDYIYDVDLKIPAVIVLGSEENGISGEYLKRSDRKARIPMSGSISSLNVSVAAGMILYEALRQRMMKANP